MTTEIVTLPLVGTVTATEWHGFVLGVVAGYRGRGAEVLDVALGERAPRSPAEEQIRAEGWYPAAGVVLGHLLAGARNT